MQTRITELKGAKTNNLKNVTCALHHNTLTVVTGVSGSGKSSLAFDTFYAEGQRRYTESLSTYARQFLQRMQKPPFQSMTNIQPAVALRQKNEINNARSTVSTVTELDDHFGLLFTHAGVTHCPSCHAVVRRDNVPNVMDYLLSKLAGKRLVIVADVEAPSEHRNAILTQLIQEGFRRMWIDGEAVDFADDEVESLLSRDVFSVVVDRVVANEEGKGRLREAIETAFGVGKGRIRVFEHRSENPEIVFDRAFACNECGESLVEPQPALFSFNSSLGACQACNGYGRSVGLDFKKIIPNAGKTLHEGAIAAFQTPKHSAWQRKLISACMKRGVPIDIPFGKLRREDQTWVKNGDATWPGVRGFFEELKGEQYKVHVRIFMAKFRGFDDCEACLGTRLSQDARNTTVKSKTIADVWAMSILEASEFFESLELDEVESAKVHHLLEEIQYRLKYLNEVGLGYLQLGRQSRTLSGGEMQRIHLTTNLGRALTDTLYVLDEPTAGLHARDSARLLTILKGLRDLGNTVLVVEHDPDIIEGSDRVIEIGPRGGEQGGELLFEGTIKEFENEDTPTSNSLHSRVRVPSNAKQSQSAIEICGASENNLENVHVKLPCGQLVAITGVSGSGKSTLMNSVLYNNWLRLHQGGVDAGAVEEIRGLEQFSELVLMDQAAIGRSSRSNPLTYSGAYDDLRKLFSKSDDAKKLGLSTGDFSFNVPGGRCESCQGLGYVTVEMHFMADIEVVCEECNGRRFGPRVLAARYRGKTIQDVFEMTIREALEFFTKSNAIRKKLQPFADVGLGYLKLGQATSTLSGGEAQRVKLASYIGSGKSRQSTDKPIAFIFDEPTIGLHLLDIETLLKALRQLIQAGDSVFVIEHNIDFIANCDWVIDLGPGAGPDGGKIVAEGPPKVIANDPESLTGQYLGASV